MKQLAILGRQPKISLGELESLYGPASIRVINDMAAVVNTDDIDIDRLGGTQKLASLVETMTGPWDLTRVETVIENLVRKEHASRGSKVSFGVSVYGPNKTNLDRLLINLKKRLRTTEKISVRVVPARDGILNAAQVRHNKLLDKGLEIIICVGNKQVLFGKTIQVQDVDAYAYRDRSKPVRDTKVGMLPPKLAQIMINLARPNAGDVIFDPFCGTGTVLIEAMNLGYGVYGSDIDERMVTAARQNVAWYQKQLKSRGELSTSIESADATEHTWSKAFDAVVSEVYLGPAVSQAPNEKQLQAAIERCDSISRSFLKNLLGQIAPGIRHCLAVPAWFVNNRFYHLPVVDDLEKLGYNLLEFEHASPSDLIYHRSGQIVARQLLIIRKQS